MLASVAMATSSARAGTMQSYQATGNLGMEISAVNNAPGALPAMSGTFTLSQIPPGAMVQKAYVYSADWASSVSLNLSFGSSPGFFTAASPFQSDTSTVINQLYAYRWDVTPAIVSAPMSYSFNIGYAIPIGVQGNQIYGAALVVVWQDPLAPLSTVTIVDGALQVGENTPTVVDTETMTFSGLPAGQTSLYTFTVADDAAGTSEVVQYNGNTVGGPVDENLNFTMGAGASLLVMNATSVAGANTVSITSPADHFGWVFSASIVPEPTSLCLLSVGLATFFALRGLLIVRRRTN